MLLMFTVTREDNNKAHTNGGTNAIEMSMARMGFKEPKVDTRYIRWLASGDISVVAPTPTTAAVFLYDLNVGNVVSYPFIFALEAAEDNLPENLTAPGAMVGTATASASIKAALGRNIGNIEKRELPPDQKLLLTNIKDWLYALERLDIATADARLLLKLFEIRTKPLSENAELLPMCREAVLISMPEGLSNREMIDHAIKTVLGLIDEYQKS